MTNHQTVQTRGYCTKRGYRLLDQRLAQLCELGNAALQERRDAWKFSRKRISYQDQCRSLTLVRKDDPDGLGKLNVAAARGALRRIDRRFKPSSAAARRTRSPGTRGSAVADCYGTIELNDGGRGHVRTSKCGAVIRINGLPTIRVRPQRRLPKGKPCSIRIARQTLGCTVDLVYEHQPAALPPTSDHVGVDVGVRKRVTLSTAETFPPEPATGRRSHARSAP